MKHVIMWQWCYYFLVHYWTLWSMSAVTDATGNIFWVFLIGVGRELNPRLYMSIPWKQTIRWLQYREETALLPAKASCVVWHRHLLSKYSHECLRCNETFYIYFIRYIHINSLYVFMISKYIHMSCFSNKKRVFQWSVKYEVSYLV